MPSVSQTQQAYECMSMFCVSVICVKFLEHVLSLYMLASSAAPQRTQHAKHASNLIDLQTHLEVHIELEGLFVHLQLSSTSIACTLNCYAAQWGGGGPRAGPLTLRNTL